MVRTVRRPCVAAIVAIGAIGGCGAPPPVTAPVAPEAKIQLAVLPADSDAFPAVARAVTAQLAAVRITGVDVTRVAKTSLEVVQLSIECVDPTDACYVAVGRSLVANRLLFARVDAGPTRQAPRVTVTLFDVDAHAARRTTERQYATEDEATAGAAALVAEVTR
jgi:hypothetical protein